MLISPGCVCSELDFSFELLFSIELWIINPLSILEIDIGPNSKSSLIEKFDFLLAKLSVQNIEVLYQ